LIPHEFAAAMLKLLMLTACPDAIEVLSSVKSPPPRHVLHRFF
jgi:hypothetical protein